MQIGYRANLFGSGTVQRYTTKRSKDTDNTIYMNIIDNVARLWLRLTNLFDTFCYTDRIFYNIIVCENRILPKFSQKVLY